MDSDTTVYCYDGDQVIAEYDGAGNLLRKFVYGPSIDEPICMIEPNGVAEDMYYYHFDGLGSVIALSNNSGELVERYSYTAFGEPNRTSDVNNPYLFTGRRYDSEAGFYYYRAHYYKPQTGRFLQTDPIGYADSMNLYQYCLNNPTNLVDPFGLKGRWTGPIYYLDPAGLGFSGYYSSSGPSWLDRSRPRDNFWGPVWDIGNGGRDAYHAVMAYGYGGAGLGLYGMGQLRFIPPDQVFSSGIPPDFVVSHVLAKFADGACLVSGLLGDHTYYLSDKAFDKMRQHADLSDGFTHTEMTSKKTDKPPKNAN